VNATFLLIGFCAVQGVKKTGVKNNHYHLMRHVSELDHSEYSTPLKLSAGSDRKSLILGVKKHFCFLAYPTNRRVCAHGNLFQWNQKNGHSEIS
jgi:hypothetical protein